MFAPQALIRAITSRVLPPVNTDSPNQDASARGGRYGELYNLSMVPTKHLLSDEGSYFVATNPTVSTGLTLTTTAQNSFVDTTPQIYFFNGDSITVGKRIYLDYIKLLVTAVPTAATAVNFAIKLDSAARALSTDNTTVITPVNPNMDSGIKSVMSPLKVQNSATASVIAAASASARLVARGNLGGIPLIGDLMVLAFGSVDVAIPQVVTAVNVGTVNKRTDTAPPLIIGPGQSFTMHIWFSGTASASLVAELEIGWWER